MQAVSGKVSGSLKDVSADSFEKAKEQMGSVIADTADPFRFLLNSAVLDDIDRDNFQKLTNRRMNDQEIRDSLKLFTRLLAKHYGKKAVLTGCLRISKESIFTGMNRISMQENPPVTGSLYNLRVLTVADPRFDEYFGFTDAEVREMLEYYGLSDAYDAVKNWYDGYCFGDAEVYCPWDVINYIDLLRTAPKAQPENYWANSSGNDVIRTFVERLDTNVMSRELEALVAGDVVMKEIRPELTYREMYDSVENIWSLLYMTGYLTKRAKRMGRGCRW